METEDWARVRDLSSIALHTRIDRDDARTFYASLGCETAATRAPHAQEAAALSRRPTEGGDSLRSQSFNHLEHRAHGRSPA